MFPPSLRYACLISTYTSSFQPHWETVRFSLDWNSIKINNGEAILQFSYTKTRNQGTQLILLEILVS